MVSWPIKIFISRSLRVRHVHHDGPPEENCLVASLALDHSSVSPPSRWLTTSVAKRPITSMLQRLILASSRIRMEIGRRSDPKSSSRPVRVVVWTVVHRWGSRRGPTPSSFIPTSVHDVVEHYLWIACRAIRHPLSDLWSAPDSIQRLSRTAHIIRCDIN